MKFTFGSVDFAAPGVTVPLSEARYGERYYVEAWIYSPEVDREVFWTALANGLDNHRPLADGSANWFYANNVRVGPGIGWQKVWAIFTFPNDRYPDMVDLTTKIDFQLRTMGNANGSFFIDNVLTAWIPEDVYLVDENGRFDHSVLKEILSDDGSIGQLTVSHGATTRTPSFNAETNTYTVYVPTSVTNVSVNAIAKDINA